MRNIDPKLGRSAVEAYSARYRKREPNLATPALRRRIAVALAVAALCASAAGCVSDMGAPTADNSGGNQMRYYGGPKYPMWSGQ